MTEPRWRRWDDEYPVLRTKATRNTWAIEYGSLPQDWTRWVSLSVLLGDR